MSTATEIGEMLADCEARESKLSPWERNFIDDITTRIGRGESLTPAQDAKLESIWDRVTD